MTAYGIDRCQDVTLRDSQGGVQGVAFGQTGGKRPADGIASRDRVHDRHLECWKPRDASLNAHTISAVRVPVAADGLFLTCAGDDTGLVEDLAREMPVVLFDRYLDPRFDCVSVDNHGGARRAAEYLVALGHVAIGARLTGTGPAEPQHIVLDTNLVERASCTPAT